MPSLADTLKQQRTGTLTRGPAGTLTEESPEEIQSLAGKIGLQAPPTTPLGAAGIGANPDQQKMMGTPAQKQAALNLATQPDQSLQDVLRRNQVRSQVTGAEQAEKQKSQDMQNLGSLGQRVSDFIDTQRQNLQQQAGQGVAVQAAGTFGANNQDLSQMTPLLAQLRANPSDMNLQLQVNQQLGRDVNTTLSPEEINNLYESSTQSLSRGGATVVSDNMTVNDAVASGKFGYDLNQLSGLLGVPAQQLQTMSIGNLRNTIDQVTQQEFQHAQQLEQKAQSGQLGQAERGEARQLGQEASRTGVRASEADMQHLTQQIQNADQVQFGGQSYKVDDLLKDSTISGIITDYMNAAPGSPDRQRLEKTEPGLIDFINKNQAVLQDAAKQLSGAAGQFTDIQTTNKTTSTLGNTISTDVAAKLVPGYGQLAAQKLDPNSVPVLAAAQSLSPDQQRSYGANLSNLAKDPIAGAAATNELKQMSADEINQLELSNTSPSAPHVRYLNDMQRYSALTNANDINSLTQQMFSAGTPPNLANDVRQSRAMDTLGLGGDPSLSKLDTNGDGQIDSVDQIKQGLLGAAPTLRGSLQGTGSQVSQPMNYQGLQVPTMPTNPSEKSKMYNDPNSDAVKASLMSRLGNAAASGKLTVQDINNNYGNASDVTNISNADRQVRINELSLLAKSPKLDDATRRQMEASVGYMQELSSNTKTNEYTQNFARLQSERGNKGALEASIPQLQEFLKNPQIDTYYGSSKSSIQNLLNNYQSQLNTINGQEASNAAAAQAQRDQMQKDAEYRAVYGRQGGR